MSNRWPWIAIVLAACSGTAGTAGSTAPPVAASSGAAGGSTGSEEAEAAGANGSAGAAATSADAVAGGAADQVCKQLSGSAATDATNASDDGGGEHDDGWDVEHPKRRHGRSVCTVADDNLARDAAAILSAKSTAAQRAPLATKPWDHKSQPERLALIERRFELDKAELDKLHQTGVVVPARLELPSYAYGYHEIFQSQLPVYITADSLFHAIFASHDAIVEQLETGSLAPALAGALDKMHCALVAAAGDYPAETVRDVDLYLTVARSLAAGQAVHSVRGDAGVDHEAAALLAKIGEAAGAERIELFGRPRLVDFTQYAPRGHYTKSEPLRQYFAAAMWASRLELNLVSRSSRSSAPGPEPDPRETPREAIDALALADLAGKSGAAQGLATVDQAWTLLAGRREDVAIDQLSALRTAAQIRSLRDPAAFAVLKAAIGNGFQRTVRLHPMPEGSTTLPAIATLIGPRIVPDAQALMPLVHSAVAGRQTVHTADVAYSFGLDRAKLYLMADLAKFPQLAGQLDAARAVAHSVLLGSDLYSAWYAAVRALAIVPGGALPSFTTSEVGADLRLNTITAAYGQLKHNYVLMAGQPYSEFGCEIPDGYIEPAPAAYDALIDYATRGARLAELLEPGGQGGGPNTAKAHFERVAATLRVIRAIVDDELANRPLTAVEKRWIGMVAELSVDKSQDITGYPPVYSGWYFDLFNEAEADGMRGAGFIADYFTSIEDGIAYAGASAPRFGVFVVDTGGSPRAFVGPVARGYEVHTPLGKRLTDEDAAKLTTVDDPWAQSYTVGSQPEPPRLLVHYDPETGNVSLKASEALGKVTIKLLDHHRVALITRKQEIKAGDNVVPFRHKGGIGAVYLQIGGFRDWVVGDSYGEISGGWGKSADEE